DRRVYFDFMIVGGIPTPVGQKVLITVSSWTAAPPQASIERSFGPKGHHETEIKAILASNGFSTDFPAPVIQEAEGLTIDGTDERRDMRDTLTFTIDPDDAKDFDDAISYKKNADGTTEIGVHIADVSYFVRPGSHLDTEAVKRATSVYLVDRTIPMLPPQLSEDLCSLKPDVDRLCFSTIFTVSGTRIVDRWFGRTIIHSRRRFTYDEADRALADSADPLNDELNALWKFAHQLREKRTEYGAIAFDSEEIKLVLNDQKKVVDFKTNRYTESHQLIEELMLLANREVASFVSRAMGKKSRVFLYRVHDLPNDDRLEELAVYLRAIGYQLTLSRETSPQKELNRMLASVKGAPEESLIRTATIRTMAKAVYATKNIGHFGLSFKDYAHFTSPIRRYPDVMVHRVLDTLLRGEKPTLDPSVADQLALHTSTREAEATEAERASVKMKLVEYMAEHLNEERAGLITGVTEFGIFVADKLSGADGMVRLMSMEDDMYAFEPKKYAVVGSKKKKVYRLGDAVTYRAVAVSLEERTIDIRLA
ncbi:MAG: VacB/RNase II family 3'-5' exoribonuclease, partial [Patescibacteria group bacterium]